MYRWRCGSILWSLTKEVAGSSTFTVMRIIFVSEFAEFSENILEKLQYILMGPCRLMCRLTCCLTCRLTCRLMCRLTCRLMLGVGYIALVHIRASRLSFEVLTLGNGSGTHFEASQCIPMGPCCCRLGMDLGPILEHHNAFQWDLAMTLGNGSGTHFEASQCIPMGPCRLTLGNGSGTHFGASQCIQMGPCHDGWEWIWDPFWSITMYSNGTLQLDARCGYSLNPPSVCYHY